MRISKKTEYGLAAVAYLARSKDKKPVSIRQISNLEKAPYAFLEKIFSELEKAGLVLASYGANGGYVLAKKAEKITVMDVVGALEKMNMVDCDFCPKFKKCLTKSVWGKIDLAIEKTLSSITVQSLIK